MRAHHRRIARRAGHLVQRPGPIPGLRPATGRTRCRGPGTGPMTRTAPTTWPADGARLLEPSIGYALGAVLAVTPELLSRPTPCRGWDLRMLLRHASESLAAIGEGIEAGRVGLHPAAEAALEVAVHGWDINQACGQRQPIPRALATALLEIALVLVPSTGRHPLFAAPVTVPATAAPSDRLAAFLGRTPRP